MHCHNITLASSRRGDNDPLRKGLHSKAQSEKRAEQLALPVRRVDG